MDTNAHQTTQETADQRIQIHVKKTHVKRVFALAETTQALSSQRIFDAAMEFGLERLEGGGQ